MTYNPGMRSHRFTPGPGLLPALALLAVASGCATDEGLRRLDSGLNELDLRQGKVAVLGVVKFQEPDQVRPPLIAMLEKTFREERRDIELLPADSVQGKLGEERARRILLDYEYQGKLRDGPLEELSDSLRGAARFLLLARVENDRTRTSARGLAGANTEYSGAGYAMGVTGRDARVTVHLYDLTRRALVATATYEGSSENTKPILAPVIPGGGSGTGVTVGPARSPEEQGYPGAPELAQVLEEPFRTFARALPGVPLPAGGTRPAGRR